MASISVRAIESDIDRAFKKAGATDCIVIFNEIPIASLERAASLFNAKNGKLIAIVQREPPPGMPTAIGISIFTIGSPAHRSYLDYSIGFGTQEEA